MIDTCHAAGVEVVVDTVINHLADSAGTGTGGSPWREIAGMVGFRNTAGGAAVTHWWDNGGNAVAFGRGGKAYVVINRGSGSLHRTFQTSLPAGTYCDVQSGRPVTVDGAGRFTANLGADTALALHTGATSGTGPRPGDGTGASFHVDAATAWASGST